MLPLFKKNLMNIMDNLHEKCAVFGIYGPQLEAARLTYFGLYALQHRGQESSGIAATDGKVIRTHKSMGLVAQVYTEEILDTLKGHMAIGHNRYATSGGSFQEHTQPYTDKDNLAVLAHNGNLPKTDLLEKFLKEKKIKTDHLNDSGLMHAAISYFLKHGETLEDSIKKLFPLFTGAFSLLVMTQDKIAAVRDAYGIRPFSLGRIGGGYVVASETCAIDTVDGIFIRDINPGEMVIIDKNGLTSYTLATPHQKLDIFEFVYFTRPDSILLGKRVHMVRKNLGKLLAQEHPLKVDIVIPVPDSSVPAAIGYAEALGLPFEFGLVKNRYIGRTFIMPDQKLRDRGVRLKLNPVGELLKGKRVAMVDDSIVRGTTMRQIVKMIRDAGATEVHVLSSCPPVRYPDFYGIATPTQQQLIGSQMPVSKIKKFVGADSLSFLSYKSLIKATELPEDVFCTSCFTGNYPIDIGSHKKNIKKITFKP